MTLQQLLFNFGPYFLAIMGTLCLYGGICAYAMRRTDRQIVERMAIDVFDAGPVKIDGAIWCARVSALREAAVQLGSKKFASMDDPRGRKILTGWMVDHYKKQIKKG